MPFHIHALWQKNQCLSARRPEPSETKTGSAAAWCRGWRECATIPCAAAASRDPCCPLPVPAVLSSQGQDMRKTDAHFETHSQPVGRDREAPVRGSCNTASTHGLLHGTFLPIAADQNMQTTAGCPGTDSLLFF